MATGLPLITIMHLLIYAFTHSLIYPFMQNKPNFRKPKMNVNSVNTKNYEQPTTNYELYKQTQFIPAEGGPNPISNFWLGMSYAENYVL